jgi:hypothetical protein
MMMYVMLRPLRLLNKRKKENFREKSIKRRDHLRRREYGVTKGEWESPSRRVEEAEGGETIPE